MSIPLPPAPWVPTATDGTTHRLPDPTMDAIANSPELTAKIDGRVETLAGSAKRPGTFIALGDSTSGVDNGAGPDGVWPKIAVAASGRRLALIANAGIGGNTTAQMLARVQADVIDKNPSICVLLGGMNDILGNVPLATTQGNIAAVCAALDAAGIVVVLGTVPPRNGQTGTTSTHYVARLNAWIKMFAASRGYAVIDFFAAVVNNRDGQYAAGIFYDATHPNGEGMNRMGQAAAAVLVDIENKRVIRSSLAPQYASVDYLGSLGNTVAYGAQLVGNALLWDTDNDTLPEGWASKAVAAVHTASVAGASTLLLTQPLTPGAYRVSNGQVQAENITITAVSGSSSPYTATLAAPMANPHPAKHLVDTAALTGGAVSNETTRFPGVGGRAFKITAVAQTGAQDVLAYPLPPKDSPWLASGGAGTNTWSVGDVLRLVGRLAVDSPASIPTGNGIEVKLRFNGPGTEVKALQKWGYATALGQALDFAADATVPAGTTSIDVVVTVNLAGGTATFIIGQVGVWNLTGMGAQALGVPA